MKSFTEFLKEASTAASEQAKRMGLQGDGHGDWYNTQGELVAKTVKGSLKFFGTRGAQKADKPDKSITPQMVQAVAAARAQGPQPQGQPQQTQEPPAEEKKKDLGSLTIAFGRFNPPTVGHEKLLNKVKSVAGKGGEYFIYPSRSNDPKKNPLDPDEKIGYMKQMFPDHAERIVNDANTKTIFDVLKAAHEQGYSDVNIVVGSDRVPEFEKLSNQYNGKLYDFNAINVVSAGARDADSEGVEGMSASKMRKAAAENDFDSFRSGVPKSLDDKAAKKLFNTVRKSMKVNEGWSLWDIAPKLDFRNLRENYYTKKLFAVGSIVENLNTGLVGKVIRSGANHLICLTREGIMFKSWITDVNEVYEIGTDEYRIHAQKMTPGQPIQNFLKKPKSKKNYK